MLKQQLARRLIVVLAIFTTALPARAQAPKRCAITIRDPQPGTSVGSVGTVKGTAQIPLNSHLWIFAHKRTVNGWWPQGGGETPIKEGQWGDIDVHYGEDRDRGEFEIAVAAVGGDADKELNKWVDTAPDRKYPPIHFPATTEGCPIARVTVTKQ